MIETIEKFLHAVRLKKTPEYSRENGYVILTIENPEYDDGLSDTPFIVICIRDTLDVGV